MARAKSDHSLRTKTVSILQIVVSIVFWIWAIVNIVTDKVPFDAGVVSFLVPMAAGICGLKSAASNGEKRKSAGKFHIIFTVSGHLVVAANYALGVWLAPNMGYMIYCIVCAALWAITGIVFTIWGKQWVNEDPGAYGAFL